jgi:hypothetical protein
MEDDERKKGPKMVEKLDLKTPLSEEANELKKYWRGVRNNLELQQIPSATDVRTYVAQATGMVMHDPTTGKIIVPALGSKPKPLLKLMPETPKEQRRREKKEKEEAEAKQAEEEAKKKTKKKSKSKKSSSRRSTSSSSSEDTPTRSSSGKIKKPSRRTKKIGELLWKRSKTHMKANSFMDALAIHRDEINASLEAKDVAQQILQSSASTEQKVEALAEQWERDIKLTQRCFAFKNEEQCNAISTDTNNEREKFKTVNMDGACTWSLAERMCVPQTKKNNPQEYMTEAYSLRNHVRNYIMELMKNPIANGAEMIFVEELMAMSGDNFDEAMRNVVKLDVFRRRMVSWCSARSVNNCAEPCEVIKPNFIAGAIGWSESKCGYDGETEDEAGKLKKALLAMLRAAKRFLPEPIINYFLSESSSWTSTVLAGIFMSLSEWNDKALNVATAAASAGAAASVGAKAAASAGTTAVALYDPAALLASAPTKGPLLQIGMVTEVTKAATEATANAAASVESVGYFQQMMKSFYDLGNFFTTEVFTNAIKGFAYDIVLSTVTTKALEIIRQFKPNTQGAYKAIASVMLGGLQAWQIYRRATALMGAVAKIGGTTIGIASAVNVIFFMSIGWAVWKAYCEYTNVGTEDRIKSFMSGGKYVELIAMELLANKNASLDDLEGLISAVDKRISRSAMNCIVRTANDAKKVKEQQKEFKELMKQENAAVKTKFMNMHNQLFSEAESRKEFLRTSLESLNSSNGQRVSREDMVSYFRQNYEPDNQHSYLRQIIKQRVEAEKGNFFDIKKITKLFRKQTENGGKDGKEVELDKEAVDTAFNKILSNL